MLENANFREWNNSRHNDLLWISADPGCGKSVLSKSLVDIDFATTESSTCYFFFKDNEHQDNLANALCAVLHQLFSDQPQLLRHAIPLWEENGDKIQQEISSLWEILVNATADQDALPVICVLDALDECRDEDRHTLITLLCEFYRQRSQAHSTGSLKFLATSCPYDNVQRWFKLTVSDQPHIWLRGENENDCIYNELNLVIDRQSAI